MCSSVHGETSWDSPSHGERPGTERGQARLPFSLEKTSQKCVLGGLCSKTKPLNLCLPPLFAAWGSSWKRKRARKVRGCRVTRGSWPQESSSLVLWVCKGKSGSGTVLRVKKQLEEPGQWFAVVVLPSFVGGAVLRCPLRDAPLHLLETSALSFLG